MIVLYYRQGSHNSRRVLNYLKANKIKHIVHDVSAPNYEIHKKEVEYLIRKARLPERLVSIKTIAYKNNPLDLSELTDYQLTRYITSNPTCLSLPIVVSDKAVMFGWSDEKWKEFKKKQNWEN